MGKQTRRIWRGFLVMMKFPKGALYHWVQWVRFCPAKWKGKVNLLCLFFLFFKKGISECLRATQWKFDYFPLKNRFFVSDFKKILTIVRFCFWEDTSEASAIFAFAFAFWGLGLAPTRHRVGIFHGSGKVPSVCPCSMLLKSLVFLRHLQKLPLT